MSKAAEGIGIELSEMSMVGVLMLSMMPAYYWVSKAPTQTAMLQRGAVAGTALLAGALTFGFSRR